MAATGLRTKPEAPLKGARRCDQGAGEKLARGRACRLRQLLTAPRCRSVPASRPRPPDSASSHKSAEAICSKGRLRSTPPIFTASLGMP